jgi:ketosteroid isomerase-like protein
MVELVNNRGDAMNLSMWVPTVMIAALAAATGTSGTPASDEETLAKLEAELRAAETAFAKTMADRDAAAFATFLSPEAVFFGRSGETRGKEAVAQSWAGLFEGPLAPFSWRPEVAVVLASGQLGLTSGPVFNPEGKQTGTFNSVWRREPDGAWKIVFDKGCPPCE